MQFLSMKSILPTISRVLRIHQSSSIIGSAVQAYTCSGYHSVANASQSSQILSRVLAPTGTPGSSWSLIPVRTKVQNNFPRPNETKRLKMSFWNRMKTRGGRAIIMRRYLKGRHVLSH